MTVKSPSIRTRLTHGGAAAEETIALSFDTQAPFELWLESLNSVSESGLASQFHEGLSAPVAEVLFDELLRVDGELKANIRSANGTLVMTDQSRIEADVDVRIAIIDGYLQGNLRATEHVVLNSSARVAGNIHTPSLSIRDGAVFEGKSFFLERSVYSQICQSRNDEPAKLLTVRL